MNVSKNGIITTSVPNVENLYTGRQYNKVNMVLTYDYETDVFKDYGYSTCLKMSPVTSPSYSNSETKTFMSYSYLIDASVVYELGQVYTVSMYAYVSEDCNTVFKLKLEHANSWISNSQGTKSVTLQDSTKGKVIHVYGKCKANTSDGKIYILFYPNQNQADVFTQGYILVAGITVVLGDEIVLPMNNGMTGGFSEGSGFTPPTIGRSFVQAKEFIEI